MNRLPREEPSILSLLLVPSLVLAVGAFVLALAAAWAWWPRPPSPVAKNEPPLLPGVTPSRFLNTGPEAQYVGTERCRECHADQHASYLETAHSRSFTPVTAADEPADGEYEHGPSRRRYRAFRAEGELRHEESLQLADDEGLALVDRPLKYLVGSGRFSRTYLAEVDGFLVQSPLTWYESPRAWRMSPGYDSTAHPSFRRNIGFDCLYCHVGRAEMIDGDFYRLKIHELAVGCERCHGPGSLHAVKHKAKQESTERAASGSEDLTIVNPRRLSRELAESICHQCHLESAASVVVRGRRREEFRPGLAWTDFCMNYGFESSNAMTVTGHVEQLRLSRCYTSDATLTCVTCHDPHATPSPAERVAHYRATCQKCHADRGCKIPVSQREASNNNDCAACHMPQSATEVAHVAFTHHRIGIHAAKPKAAPSHELRNLVPVLGSDHLESADRQRTLGLAYLGLYHGNEQDELSRSYRLRAERLFAEAEGQGLVDSNIAAARAMFAAAAADLPHSRQFAEQAVGGDSLSPAFQPAMLGVLAKAYLRENRISDAADVLMRLVKQRSDPGDWMMLGTCRHLQQDVDGAIQAFEHALKLDPAAPEIYDKLAPLYRARGDDEQAQNAKEKANLLRANLPQYLPHS